MSLRMEVIRSNSNFLDLKNEKESNLQPTAQYLWTTSMDKLKLENSNKDAIIKTLKIDVDKKEQLIKSLELQFSQKEKFIEYMTDLQITGNNMEIKDLTNQKEIMATKMKATPW